ncbi:unnamed protein product [Vicia faba]|uniref:Uncharacterized protein n=1 Tax=Vicia faba TaxID=3906 RepID=A0AAV0YG76_VICFA|nr:unnamed protein product [Vicia faba]
MREGTNGLSFQAMVLEKKGENERIPKKEKKRKSKEDEYKVGLQECKKIFTIGFFGLRLLCLLRSSRFDLSLQKFGADVKNWRVLSLGKGYYQFNFASAEDVRRFRASGTLNLNPGYLKLFSWSKDFNLASQ